MLRNPPRERLDSGGSAAALLTLQIGYRINETPVPPPEQELIKNIPNEHLLMKLDMRIINRQAGSQWILSVT